MGNETIGRQEAVINHAPRGRQNHHRDEYVFQQQSAASRPLDVTIRAVDLVRANGWLGLLSGRCAQCANELHVDHEGTKTSDFRALSRAIGAIPMSHQNETL